jgi:hypothetical protein
VNRIEHGLTVLLATTLLLAGCGVWGGSPQPAVPGDFELWVTSGSAMPGGGHVQTIELRADGHGSYRRYDPSNILETPRDTLTFVCTPGQLRAIWAEIELQHFIELAPRYESNSFDGTFIHIVVLAHGRSHSVRVSNRRGSRFCAVVDAIRATLPSDSLFMPCPEDLAR